MKKLNSNILFVITAVVLLLAIPAFNYFVDPYGVFFDDRTAVKEFEERDRDIIYPQLKSTLEDKYDVVLIGDSNADGCFLESDYKDLTGKTLTKITLRGISPQEQFHLLRVYHTLHPEQKNYIITLNYMAFRQDPFDKLPKFVDTEDTFTWLEYVKLLYSSAALKDSIELLYLNTLYSSKSLFLELKVAGKFDKIKFLDEMKMTYPDRVLFKKLRLPVRQDLKVNKKNYATLKKMLAYCKKHGLKPIFIINPVHTYTLCNFYESGIWSDYMSFKRNLSKITEYYDFNYVNKYNSSPISFSNPYWDDVMHPTTAYGKGMLTFIVSDDYDEKIIMTKDNSKAKILQQTSDIQDFIEENESLVDKIMKHKAGDLTPSVKYLKL